VVIGVGLNVNAESSGFPAELREKATSLKISAGRPFRRVDVLARFLDSFAECYGAFMSGGFKHREGRQRGNPRVREVTAVASRN
jgi:BirA family biotin operon repressor/biotin-[acetyl-CoA-carboxylase] ligase